MDFVKVDLPPGLSRRGTLYQTQGRWYDSNFVRWYEGAMMPIGAWVKRITTPITGKGRAMQVWRANDNTRFFAVGTESNLYVATPSLTAMVDITPAGFTAGHADAANGGGYGVGLYGVGTYGTPRADTTAIAYEASMWQLDTFGQYLAGCMNDDGKLYEWQLDTGTPAAAISGAPTGCSGLVMTPDEFILALGAGGDSRKVAWCDQGIETDWTPTDSNQAGDFNLHTYGQILCGARTRSTVLIFTDLDVHAATYIGLPYVYSFGVVGENCGAISRGCSVAPDSRLFWMSPFGFFAWDGAAVQQMSCDVSDAVFGDLNYAQRSKISATLQAAFSEAWWFYPSASSSENDMAVVYNYKENTWALHQITRLCGADSGIYSNPMMVDDSGYVWDHETGVTWDSTPYAESGPTEIGNGERRMRVGKIIFDEGTQGDVVLYAKTRNWNNDADVTYGPFAAPNPVKVRFSGRAVRTRVEFQGAGQWGAWRAAVAAGSRR